MKLKPDLVVEHVAGQYPVFVSARWLDGIALATAERTKRLVFVTDNNVDRLYGETFQATLEQHSVEAIKLTVPPGEASKSLRVVNELYEQLLARGIDRQTTMVALGGGVVGDIAGFVAATWMRGIDLIQIPTTLLAQVDSSIGGKSGVNIPGAKNIVGAFWQPVSVFIDTSMLETLSEEEFTSGLAEVVKYGVILDAKLFKLLETQFESINQRDPAVMADIVRRCCQLKADVVRQDERETTGARAVLNFGHTAGHALESVFGYGTWRHGHAVAAGMMIAARMALQLGRVKADFVERLSKLLRSLRIPQQFPENRHDELLAIMNHDKKARNGKPRFVLPTKIGHVELVDEIDSNLILSAMRQSSESHE